MRVAEIKKKVPVIVPDTFSLFGLGLHKGNDSCKLVYQQVGCREGIRDSGNYHEYVVPGCHGASSLSSFGNRLKVIKSSLTDKWILCR